jgi:hypothetical protein
MHDAALDRDRPAWPPRERARRACRRHLAQLCCRQHESTLGCAIAADAPGRPAPAGCSKGAVPRRCSGPANRLPETGRAGPYGVRPRQWRIPICFHPGDSFAAPDDASRPFGPGSPRGPRHPVCCRRHPPGVPSPGDDRAGTKRYMHDAALDRDQLAWPTRGAGPEGTAGVIWRSFAVASMKANWDAPSARRRPADRPLLVARSGAVPRRCSGPAHRVPETGRGGPYGVPPRRWRIPMCFHPGDSFAAPDDASRPFGPGSPRGPRHPVC